MSLLTNESIRFDPEVLTNLVVIGDSKFEMDAGEVLGKNIEKCILK